MNSKLPSPEMFVDAIEKLGLDRIRRHILICADQTKPLCCSQAESLVAWDYLKRRLRELGLETGVSTGQERHDDPSGSIFRTKVNCLRVCHHGPILVVYPDGVWYHSAMPPVIERIIQEHLLNNRVVTEYAFLVNSLALSPDCLTQ
jgi:(2Fe-2S) ferredoxin